MTKIDRSLAETFGLPTDDDVSDRRYPTTTTTPIELPEDNDDDYEFVRKTLHSLIKSGSAAFDNLADLAADGEKISAFATMNDMLTNLANISTQLLEVKKIKKEIEASDNPVNTGQNTVTNNVAFIGTTADLARLINDKDVIDV